MDKTLWLTFWGHPVDKARHRRVSLRQRGFLILSATLRRCCRASRDVTTCVKRQRFRWRHFRSSVTWQRRKTQPTLLAIRKQYGGRAH